MERDKKFQQYQQDSKHQTATESPQQTGQDTKALQTRSFRQIITFTMVMKPTMNQALLAAGCIAGAVLLIGTQTDSAFSSRRRLDMSFHLSQLHERDVDSLNYDTTLLQHMSSPCRPEYDGYFGSTSGTPFEIQYGFEMETEDEQNVDYLLEEIHEQIIDVVLSNSFPNLCGFRRRELQENNVRGLSTRESQLKAKPRTTGFRFGKDLKDRQSKHFCSFCGICCCVSLHNRAHSSFSHSSISFSC